MTTKNCANGPKLVLKDLCEKSLVRNVLYSGGLFTFFVRCENLHSITIKGFFAQILVVALL